MCILALDPGKVKVGVAISDELQITSNPIDMILYDDDFDNKIFILLQRNIEKVIIGKPVDTNDQFFFDFKHRVENVINSNQLNILTEFVPEDFSTQEARSIKFHQTKSRDLSKKHYHSEHNDSIAAAIILQNYLN